MASVLAQADNFASLSVLHLSSPSHLLASSCSPDKDLLLVISRLGGKDTISLWKMQGGRKWEVDVSTGDATHEDVTGVAWSPDGMSILISHHPPRLSIHSIQDGRQERSVPIPPPYYSDVRLLPTANFRITNVWWLRYEDAKKKGPEMPDFFKRNKTIPGSALSQLKMQPLLDPLKDETAPIIPSDLFSFQGVLPTSTTKTPKLPLSVANWPALPSDFIAASIKPFPRPGDPQRRPGGPHEEVLDDVRVENSLNYDSLVIVADDRGRCHFFMDATYSLGAISVGKAPEGTTCHLASIAIPPLRSSLLAHLTYRINNLGTTNLFPMYADLSPLRKPQAREVAKASSAARELTWYMIRAVEVMRATWQGSAEYEAAGSVGLKWVKEIEKRQRQHNPAPGHTAIMDLTTLLVTGRPSEALCDVFGTLGERGLSQWEQTMTEALTRIRDFAEKRIALVAQRLHIILEDVLGWSRLPETFGVHLFQENDVLFCQRLLRQMIILCAWIASMAREQLWRFREFKIWLQFESNRANGGTEEKIRALGWDVLEVNRYLVDGLNGCGLDMCFNGRGPTDMPDDLRCPLSMKSLSDVLQEAKDALKAPLPKPWNRPSEQKDITKLDRNILALTKDLSYALPTVFQRAGAGVGTEVSVQPPWTLPLSKGKGEETAPLRTRECTIVEDGILTEYVMLSVPSLGEHHERLCLLKLQIPGGWPEGQVQLLQAATIACQLQDDNGVSLVDVLDFQFFDEETIVLVVRPHDGDRRGLAAYVVTVAYRELEFLQIDAGPNLAGLSREKLACDVTSSGECGNWLRLTGSRKLCLRSTEGVSMTVNGRVGRRTVCVMDGKGVEVEVLDMAEEAGMEEGGEEEQSE